MSDNTKYYLKSAVLGGLVPVGLYIIGILLTLLDTPNFYGIDPIRIFYYFLSGVFFGLIFAFDKKRHKDLS